MTDILEWEELDFHDRLAIKLKSERSFLNFTRIWFELIQGDRMLVNWHHRWIAREVDKVVRGETPSINLAISIPPGGTKTELMSIHLPAYTNMLVQNDTLKRFRNLNLSFADTLVKRNSRRTRDIINSAEYQELWPCEFGVNQAEEWEVINSKGKSVGQTVSRAMGGQITGGRGGYFGEGFSGAVSLDDPDKPEDMFSLVKREASHRKMTNTVRSRRGDKSKYHPTPFFIIQQRLHLEDTIGYCVAGGLGVEFEQIVIPALISREYLDTLDEDTRNQCWDIIKDSDSRAVGGVEYWSYWPEMEHIDQLIDLWEKDEYTFMSQYQQKPTKVSGGLVDTSWFGRYTQLPYIERVVIYVDTNSGKVKDHNDFTVFTVCGLGQDGNLYVLYISRGKWAPDTLLTEAESLWKNSHELMVNQVAKPSTMNIEDKQAGQGLIQTLKDKNKIPVVSVQRGTEQNKYARHCNAQPQIKMGKVFIPALHNDDGTRNDMTYFYNGDAGFNTSWVTPFLSEMDLLTVEVLMDQEKGYDDQYDTLMDAVEDMVINQSRGSGLVLGKRRR